MTARGLAGAALVAVLAIAGCSRALPPRATAVDAERAHVELAQLQRGRALLISKCGSSCHRTPRPAEHTAREWPAAIDEMSARAHLTAGDRQLIQQYLIAMSGR